jgi:hypothetical protein
MKRLPYIIIAIICIAGVVIWKVNSNTQPSVLLLGPTKIPKMRRSQNLTDDELKTAVAGEGFEAHDRTGREIFL